MNDDFTTIMHRWFKKTRAGNPVEAMRLIQAAVTQKAGATSAVQGRSALGQGDRPGAVLPRRARSQVTAGLERRPSSDVRYVGRKATRSGVANRPVFERRHHDGLHGAMDYWLFRPSDRGRPIRGVVLMLHGCSQSPEDFAMGTRMNMHAEQHGLIVVYPEQNWSYSALNCWNWFRPSDQGRSGGEPALLAGLVASVASEHEVPPIRVFVAGLSAGGAMAAVVVQTHPELFGAVGIHSGLAWRSARNFVTAFGAMRGHPAPHAEALRVPAIIFHGSADTKVAPVNAGRLAGPLSNSERRSGETTGRQFDNIVGGNAAGNAEAQDGGPTGRQFDIHRGQNEAGHAVEVWRIDGAGHAWSGGHADGSYTDPAGPDASAEMVRFFLSREREAGGMPAAELRPGTDTSIRVGSFF